MEELSEEELDGNKPLNCNYKNNTYKNEQLREIQIHDNTESDLLFGVNDVLNNNNESASSSRSSTITSYNWIRRSFEDLDIEVVQTEIMQKRKRKDSNLQQQLNKERKHPSLSFSTSLNSEDLHYRESKNSKAVPYGDKDASNCFECRRMFGQVIDDAIGAPGQTETSNYPCDCPISEISCCDNCCFSSTMNNGSDESNDTLMVSSK